MVGPRPRGTIIPSTTPPPRLADERFHDLGVLRPALTRERFGQTLICRAGVRDDEDQILEHELGKVGQEGGKVGAQLAGTLTGQSVPTLPEELGGGVGARSAAKRLPKDTYEVSLRLDVPAATAVQRAYKSLLAEGRVLTEDQDGESPEHAYVVRGVIKAGYLNMNPAVVTITISPLNANTTLVQVRGAAKEGLVKQRAGEKAAERIAAVIRC
jgi:hypothetical protein